MRISTFSACTKQSPWCPVQNKQKFKIIVNLRFRGLYMSHTSSVVGIVIVVVIISDRVTQRGLDAEERPCYALCALQAAFLSDPQAPAPCPSLSPRVMPVNHPGAGAEGLWGPGTPFFTPRMFFFDTTHFRPRCSHLAERPM